MPKYKLVWVCLDCGRDKPNDAIEERVVCWYCGASMRRTRVEVKERVVKRKV